MVQHTLQDGGDDFAEIMMPERQDLMDQWDIVSTAWQQVDRSQRQVVHVARGGELCGAG